MDKSYLKSLSQKVLNKEFSNIQKRKIREYGDRLNMACPYCGDSDKRSTAKRGNVYFNRLFYVCFNCNKKTTFDRFCRDFDEHIDPDKKLEMIEYLDEVMTYTDYENDFVDAKFDDLISLEDLEKAFEMNITPITDFQPIKKGGGIYKYLIGRGIVDFLQKNIYQAKFWITDEQYQWVIVMLNRRDDKILGLQVRNLKQGKRRMFKIYNYENLLEWVNLTKGVENNIDINQLVIYNKLSYYFNILNVDLTRTITVFEGYLDSLFYPNSIGLVGVNTDYKFIENNELNIQYFFDNDKAGLNKSEEKLEEGYPVFLWNKLFEDIVNKKNSKEPHKLYNRISSVKDINKLNELVPNSFKLLNLSNFFSKDILDKKWLPKIINKKFDENLEYNLKFDKFKRL